MPAQCFELEGLLNVLDRRGLVLKAEVLEEMGYFLAGACLAMIWSLILS